MVDGVLHILYALLLILFMKLFEVSNCTIAKSWNVFICMCQHNTATCPYPYWNFGMKIDLFSPIRASFEKARKRWWHSFRTNYNIDFSPARNLHTCSNKSNSLSELLNASALCEYSFYGLRHDFWWNIKGIPGSMGIPSVDFRSQTGMPKDLWRMQSITKLKRLEKFRW